MGAVEAALGAHLAHEDVQDAEVDADVESSSTNKGDTDLEESAADRSSNAEVNHENNNVANDDADDDNNAKAQERKEAEGEDREEDQDGEPFTDPVLLFIHGLGVTGTFIWRKQIDILTQEYGMRVIAVDLRGHGASVPLAYHVDTLYELVEDCIAVLDDAKVKKAVWCGSGLGSRIALRAGLAFPDRTAALVLLGSQARAATWGEVAVNSILCTFAQQCGFNMVRNVLERQLITAEFETSHPEESTAFRENVNAQDPEAILAMVTPLNKRSDISEELQDLDIPTLILHGEMDRIISYTDAKAMADTLPDTEIVVLSGVGHLLSLEAPRDVAEEIHGFVDARLISS
ncbi:Protein ABHD8 [Hondaea fermentalgiana]|uniref:Protein ABHD8 n=1 Tax=Hondaea fermentalgiana TaxID=2315210 RepID=A0A2R5GUB2_9STRA|nr:Protein ABHD8 [Hondaea fermentalgiana]|eukprot:GBG33348.1 Protein ABHD8 [Hondaea fermentalgiana]